MKLSIIIPVYNCENYLNKCLESIVSEIVDEDNIEILVIDDGSTDNSSLIYNKYKKYIKIYKNENHGVSYTRNYGIKMAVGNYIMFVDSDDYLEKGWFTNIKEELNNQNDIVFFNDLLNKADLNKAELIKHALGFYRKQNIYISSPCGRIFKKDILIRNNIFFIENIINGEDMLFNIECIIKANRIKYAGNSFYCYRINTGSATHNFNKKIFTSDILFHRNLEKILNYSDLDDEHKKNLTNFCKKNAIMVLANRVSFIDKYSEAKKEFNNLLNPVYKEVIEKLNLLNMRDLIIHLIYKGHFYLVYKILRLKNKLKKEEREEYIIKI